jgi:hypothetical protein
MHSWVNPSSGVAASRLCEQGGDAQGKAASASPSSSASTPRAGAARPLRLHERFAGILLAANGLMGLCAGRPARCVHFSAEIPSPSAPDGGRGGGGGGGGGLRALALRAAVAGGGKAAPPAAQGVTHVPATAVLLECDETLLAVVVEGMPPPPSSSSLPPPQGPASVVVGPPTEATCIALARAVLDACVCAFGPAVIHAGSGLFWTEAGRAREGTAAALDVIGSRFAATAGSAALLAWGVEGEGEREGVRAAHAVPTTTPLAPSALTAAAWALPTVPVATLSRAAEITPLIRAARASLIREYLAERGADAAASLAATATAVSAVAAFASMGGGHGRAALSVDDVLPAPEAPASASASAGPSKEGEGVGAGEGGGGEAAAATTEAPPDASLSLPASAEPALVARRSRQGESLKLKPRRPAPGAVSATRGAIASPPPVPPSTSSSRRTSAADTSDASFRGQLNVFERLSAPSSEARRRPSKAPSSSPASSPAPAPAAPQPSHALNPRMQLPFVAYLSSQILNVAQKAASALARGADADGDADAGRLAVEGVAALWVRRTGADPHAHANTHTLHAPPPHVSVSALAPSPFNSPVSLLSPAHAELVGLAARVHGLAAMRAWPSVGQAAGEAAPLLLPVHAFSREAEPARLQAVSPTHALSSAGQLGLLVPVAAGPAAAASDTSPLPLPLCVRSFAVVLSLWPVPPGPLPPPMQHIEDHEDAFVGVAVLVSEPALPFPHPKPPRPPAAAAAADGADVEEIVRGRTSAAEASLASALVGPAAREAARALASHAAATALFACEGEWKPV